jgi:hypothetical protein
VYAFLIVLKVILPNQETHSFEIYSRGQFAEPVCRRMMKEAAERASDYAMQRIRFVHIVTTTSCIIRPTRSI